MKKIILAIISIFSVICLCACGSVNEASNQNSTDSAAQAEPVYPDAAPVSDPLPDDLPDSAPTAELYVDPFFPDSAPVSEGMTEDYDPLEYVRFDWKPTQEQADELFEYALPYIQDQPYFSRAEFCYGNNYDVYVNCDPSELDDSIIPFMRAVRDKFYEMRTDTHEVIYILFIDDTVPEPYPLSYSVEDVP